jgi:hypothetical protein
MKYYLKDDGETRTHDKWRDVIADASTVMTDYAASLRASADIHDDRNHHAAEDLEQWVRVLSYFKRASEAKLPIEIDIAGLSLEIGRTITLPAEAMRLLKEMAESADTIPADPARHNHPIPFVAIGSPYDDGVMVLSEPVGMSAEVASARLTNAINQLGIHNIAAQKQADVRDAESSANRREITDGFTDRLGALGVNNLISMVSNVTVMVDAKTLEALIGLAETAITQMECAVCGSTREVRMHRAPHGRDIPTCVLCREENPTPRTLDDVERDLRAAMENMRHSKASDALFAVELRFRREYNALKEPLGMCMTIGCRNPALPGSGYCECNQPPTEGATGS